MAWPYLLQVYFLFSVVESISVGNSLGDQMPGNIVVIVTSGELRLVTNTANIITIISRQCDVRPWPCSDHGDNISQSQGAPAADDDAVNQSSRCKMHPLWCRYDECDPWQCSWCWPWRHNYLQCVTQSPISREQAWQHLRSLTTALWKPRGHHPDHIIFKS